MNKSGTKKFFAILAFLVSAAFSIINFWGTSTLWHEQIIYSIAGIILEFGKVSCLYSTFVAIKNKKVDPITYVTAGLYIPLVLFSIFFSMCFTMNSENTTQNRGVTNSAIVQAAKSKTEGFKKSVEQDDVSINAQLAVIAKLPNNYITERGKQTAILKSLQDQRTKDNNDYIASLTPSEASGTVLADTKATNGFISMLAVIADSIQQKDMPLNDAVRFWFYLLFSAVFELTASMLWYLADVKEGFEKPVKAPESGPEKPKIQKTQRPPHVGETVAKKPIGFECTKKKEITPTLPEGITSEMLDIYSKYLFENRADDGQVPGYKKASKELTEKGLEDYDSNLTRKLHGVLQTSKQLLPHPDTARNGSIWVE